VIDPALKETEIALLSQGISYPDIARITGGKLKSIAERNRQVYKIDVQYAFRQKIETEGFPCRLSVSDSFGYWFAGLFDGEGCFVLCSSLRTDPKYYHTKISVTLGLRDDDADVIRRIKDNFGIGCISNGKAHGSRNPQMRWKCDNIADLVEIMIPFFETYTLYSKKAREFLVWKKVAMERYVLTLGGNSHPCNTAERFKSIVRGAMAEIEIIRTYRNSHNVAETK